MIKTTGGGRDFSSKKMKEEIHGPSKTSGLRKADPESRVSETMEKNQ